MELGHVPLFPCIGHSETGDPYNLSSDELAKTLAVVLDARKLFLVTAEDVFRAVDWLVPEEVSALDDGRIFRMALPAAESFLKLNVGKGGLESLTTAVAACREGVERAHIIDGRVTGVLLKEIFSNLGVGTMIFGDAYERIRPMEPSDVPGAVTIMRPLIDAGFLVERSREDLEKGRDDYVVYAMDGVVHGCAALHIYEDGTGEIAGLAVDPAYVQLGIGAKLVGRLLETAAEEGLTRVVALTVRAADWFIAQGFREGGIEDLPSAKQVNYNIGRNSRVLVRDVSGQNAT
jgi:amino-acid N-acetyltransferase